MSNIACPKCGAAVSGSAVSLETLVARCEACDHVFRFDDQLAPSRQDSALALPARPERFVVKGGEVLATDEATYRTAPTSDIAPLAVQWRWFVPQAIFAVFFALAWDAFLVFWYWMAFTKGGPWVMFVFPLAHVAVGVAVTYGALSKLLNSTIVTVDAKELRSATAPIRNPLRANVVLPLEELAGFEIVEKRGKGSTSYEVIARDDGGRSNHVGAFEARNEASYLVSAIQQQIARLGRTVPRLAP